MFSNSLCNWHTKLNPGILSKHIILYNGQGLKNNAESSLPNLNFIQHLKLSKRNTLFVTVNKSLTQMSNYFKASVLRYANYFPLEMGRFFRRQILGLQNGCL